jgi:hypothetical protein
MAGLHSLLNRICLNYPDLQYLCHIIPFLPLSVRKDIMTLCRVQQSPWSNQRLQRSISSSLHFRFSATIRRITSDKSFQQDVLPIILDYIDDIVILGFISMALRVIPLEDETSALEQLETSLDKEIDCLSGSDRPMILDYRCLFGPNAEDRYEPLLQGTHPRPLLADQVHQQLIAWKVTTPHYASSVQVLKSHIVPHSVHRVLSFL